MLFLGDSHLDGVVSTADKLSSILERELGDATAKPRNDPTAYRELTSEILPGLFWQGLQQADWFLRQPERWPVVRRKAAHTIDQLTQLCVAHDSALVWVLLPSLDLLLPDRLEGTGPRAVAAAEGGMQQRIHDDLLELLAERQASVIDLLPEWSSLGTEAVGLYAVGCHVFLPGRPSAHRRVAAAGPLAPPAAPVRIRDRQGGARLPARGEAGSMTGS